MVSAIDLVALAVPLIAINGVIALASLHDPRLITVRVDRSLQTMSALAEVEDLAESAGHLRGYRRSGETRALASRREAQAELGTELGRLPDIATDDIDSPIGLTAW